MGPRIRALMHRLRQALTQPLDELDRWERTARFLYELGRCGLRQLKYDRAPQMAGELAFRTLFGLLPVMIVATILVKAMGMDEWFIGPLQNLLESAGLDQMRVVPISGSEAESESLLTWLTARMREATHVNVMTIGWVGVVVTIYAAIGLVVSVENSFNTIYRVPRGRPWTRRLPLYWFVLTVSPLVVISATYLNGRFEESLATLAGWTWLSTLIGWTWSLAVIWAMMTFVYLLMPNGDVHVQPAVAGAFVSAVLLEIGKRSLGAYLQNALSISQLYGSLGLVPLFMFWVYVMWLIVLFGLEVAAILQTVQTRPLARLAPLSNTPVVLEPTAVITLMEIVAENFAQGKATSMQDLCDRTAIPESILAELRTTLEDQGFIHPVAGQDASVTLARPPETILAEDLMQLGFELADRYVVRQSALTEPLRLVQLRSLGETTLAGVSTVASS